MNEQARGVRNEAVPEWAQRRKDSGIVRFSFEMLETLKVVVEDQD